MRLSERNLSSPRGARLAGLPIADGPCRARLDRLRRFAAADGALQLANLVAQQRGLLELQVVRRPEHLFLKLLDGLIDVDIDARLGQKGMRLIGDLLVR